MQTRKKMKQLSVAQKRERSKKAGQPKKTRKFQISLVADVIFRFENSAFLRLLIILSIPAALYSLGLQYTEVSAGNLGRSWSNLTTQSSGNSGKVSALEHLSDEIGELPYLDLSCAAMGGVEAGANGESVCSRPTYLAGLDLFDEKIFRYTSAFIPGSNLDGTEIQFADFRYGFLENVSFKEASLIGANLFQASLGGAQLDGANLTNSNWSYATAERTSFRNANLYSSVFYAAYMPEADFTGANVSHAYFFGALLDDATFDDAWAWIDMPPVGLPAVSLCDFDSTIHNRWEKPKICQAAKDGVTVVSPISLTSPIEEAKCDMLQSIKLFLMELTNGGTSRQCWKNNPSYVLAWTSGQITSEFPSLRWDQLLD